MRTTAVGGSQVFRVCLNWNLLLFQRSIDSFWLDGRWSLTFKFPSVEGEFEHSILQLFLILVKNKGKNAPRFSFKTERATTN